jgi:hypothetical protein
MARAAGVYLYLRDRARLGALWWAGCGDPKRSRITMQARALSPQGCRRPQCGSLDPWLSLQPEGSWARSLGSPPRGSAHRALGCKREGAEGDRRSAHEVWASADPPGLRCASVPLGSPRVFTCLLERGRRGVGRERQPLTQTHGFRRAGPQDLPRLPELLRACLRLNLQPIRAPWEFLLKREPPQSVRPIWIAIFGI